MDVVPDGLALADDTDALALERGADETGNLDRVGIGELLLEEDALGRAKDRWRAPENKAGVSLLVGVEEEEVNGTVKRLVGDRLELLEVEVGVDALLNEVAELVGPIDEDTGSGL